MRSKVSWLIYVHASNPKDFKSSEECLLDMQKILQPNVDAYVIFFGYTLNSPCTLRYYDRNRMSVLMMRENKGFSNIKRNLCDFVSVIKSLRTDVRAFC